MADEHEDLPEGDLDRPPAFFPYSPDFVEAEPQDLGEPVEVSVEGVFIADDDGDIKRFVVLSDNEQNRKLPIVIGSFEAQAINLPLEGEAPARPLAHDLLKNVIDKLGGILDRVVIDDMWSTTFYAKLYIRRGKEEIEVDSRPSDAIALALRFDAPIFVREGIFEQSMG